MRKKKTIATMVVFSLLGSSAWAAPDISFTVNASEAVTVNTAGGTPRLQLDVGGVTRYASYASGSGTAALTFTYTTQAGDLDLDGIAVSSPLQLNGGTIADTAGNAMSPLTFTVPTTSGVRVDHPSLLLNFTGGDYLVNGTHHSTISAAGGTFTRASTGTYFDSSGVLQTAASGVARFDYDPITHTAKGILIEEAKTNLLLYSNAFSTSAPWWATAAITTAGTTTAPDGSTVPNYNFPNTQAIYQDAVVTNGLTYTHSIWIKANQNATIGFRLPGQVGATSAPLNVTTQWQRFTVTAVAVAGATRFLVDNRTVNGYGTPGLTLALFGGQAELGSHASSYIPTGAATATRQSDILTFPTSGWFNAATGTMMVEGDMSTTVHAVNPGSAAIDDGTVNNAYFMGIDTLGYHNFTVFSGAGGTKYFEFVSPGIYTPPAVFKHALSYAVNDVVGAFNGTISPVDTSVTLPVSPSILRIGDRRGAGQRMDGHIRQFKYYPARVSNASVQALTQ